MTYATLDDWLNEVEGFATRAERLHDEFGPQAQQVLFWIRTAWQLGVEGLRAMQPEHVEEVLEWIYAEAVGNPKLGSPLLMLPAKNVLRTTDGKFPDHVFVDLRLVIDLIKAGRPIEREGTPG